MDIFYEVRQGNVDHVRRWLASVENDPNCTDEHGFTPLHWAVRQGHKTLVDMLLARGAKVNCVNMGGDTPVHLAAAHGHMDIIRSLIKQRADLRFLNEHGNTPLHYACFWNYSEVAELLLSKGANVAQANKDNQTPLDKCRRRLCIALKEKAKQLGQEIETIPFRAGSATYKSKTDHELHNHDADINMSHLNLSLKMSDTSTGELWKGIWAGHTVVAKKLKVNGNLTKPVVENFREEFMKCRIFSHPNLLPVLGAVVQPPTLAVVSQFIPHGSLFLLLHKPTGLQYNDQHCLEWALDIASGLSYLQSLELSSPKFSLRSHHMMVEDDLTVRINLGDAHWSVLTDQKLYYPQWTPPEVLYKGLKNVNIKAVNIWNFAIILFELVTRQIPFDGMTPALIGMKIAKEGLKPKVPADLSPQISRLIQICLNHDPAERPSLSKIHPIVERMVREKIPLKASAGATKV
ncbi:integrin-linked protein kinase-like [Corticium candelabrum]|uniref:integrin-linked protein kinase-like n=1 Tax=Corticium candelabrum TaxID=121492 RepID=UPI002E2660DE|nr:integrin-linked protein kinase-like [Corticium candelabrum]